MRTRFPRPCQEAGSWPGCVLEMAGRPLFGDGGWKALERKAHPRTVWDKSRALNVYVNTEAPGRRESSSDSAQERILIERKEDGEELVPLQRDGRWTPCPPRPPPPGRPAPSALCRVGGSERTDAGPAWPEFRPCLRHFRLGL